MKKIPILVEKFIPMSYKFIEWQIHNVCTYDCSFCSDRHKDGTRKWFTLDQYKEYTDKIVEQCQGMPFWIQITGGEPTVFPELLELLKYIKSKGAMISLISNGTRTIRWWEQVKEANVLDLLFLTYHSEQTTDYKHIVDLINLFHDRPVEVICLITHVKESLDLAFEAQEYITKNTGVLINIKAMFINEYDIYDWYTHEQLDRIKRTTWINGDLAKTKVQSKIPHHLKIRHTLKITNEDGSKEITEPQILMKDQTNVFTNWLCEIGVNTMRIDHDIVYRGVCQVGGEQKLSDENMGFAKDAVTCTSKICFCGTDMIAKKTLNR